MDDLVLRGLARWPNVPDVYGWLSLDRRGEWRLKGERIGNPALREFIGRNYACDAHGRWFFQNGPQRVFVTLAYTPLVARHGGEGWLDHCGRAFDVEETLLDDEGSVLLAGEGLVALVDDRELERFIEVADRLPRIARAEVPVRFAYVPEPRPVP